jgi:hypothetical protein
MPEYDPTVTVNLPVLAVLLGLAVLLAVTAVFNNRLEWRVGKRFAPLLRVLALGMVLLVLATERGNYLLAIDHDRMSDAWFQLKTSFLQEYRLLHLFVILWTFPLIAAVLVIADIKSLLGKGSIGFLLAELLALAGLVVGIFSGHWLNIVSAHVN